MADRTATYNEVVDGEEYKVGDTIPDMGTLVCVAVENGNRRSYEGLSSDVGKLPHYETLETGSQAFFYDTAEVYKYEKTTDTWYKL